MTFTNLKMNLVKLYQVNVGGDHEPTVVEHPLLSTTPWVFLLLLLFDFGCL